MYTKYNQSGTNDEYVVGAQKTPVGRINQRSSGKDNSDETAGPSGSSNRQVGSGRQSRRDQSRATTDQHLRDDTPAPPIYRQTAGAAENIDPWTAAAERWKSSSIPISIKKRVVDEQRRDFLHVKVPPFGEENLEPKMFKKSILQDSLSTSQRQLTFSEAAPSFRGGERYLYRQRVMPRPSEFTGANQCMKYLKEEGANFIIFRFLHKLLNYQPKELKPTTN